MKSTLYCRMEGSGQEVYRLVLPWNGPVPDKEMISITGFYKEELGQYVKKTTGVGYGEVTDLHLDEGWLTIDTTCFSLKKDLKLTIGDQCFTKTDFEEVLTDGLDRFEAITEGDVVYRLAAPADSTGPRPLILFLHGGGNGGSKENRDNLKHLIADYGPINMALKYPDLYVMAPQAIETWNPFLHMTLKKVTFYSESDPEHGWSRSYLGKVCDIIRRMIAEGKVDPKRVYVTGFSMGGAGTLKAMSVASDLFAACVPICPTMSQETFRILCSITAPIWTATSYVDHMIYRHKYIVDGILALKDAGHKNAHLTIYAPEELAKYDIGVGDNLPYDKLFGENHLSWVPTYHDEYGIMSWMLNQHKD